MVAEERRLQICELLGDRRTVSLGELTARFGVSSETIRRDLLALETAGALRRTHGGAMSLSPMLRSKTLLQRTEDHPGEKRALSLRAIGEIADGDTVAIDAGSTARELVRLLPGRFHALTVVTASLDVVEGLRGADEIRLIVCGGDFLRSENAFCGQPTLDALEALRVDKAFLCPAAVSLRGGVMDHVPEILPVQRQMLHTAGQVFFLADSSKLEKTDTYRLKPLEAGDTVVTDGGAPEALCRAYQKAGVQVLKGDGR